MTTPTLLKTWQFKVNQSVTGTNNTNDNAEKFLFELKEALIGNGSWTDGYGNATTSSGNWEVIGSNDGTVAGLDGYDRIITSDDFRVGLSSGGWIVLRQTAIGTNFEVCLAGAEWQSSADNGDIVISVNGFGAANGGTDGSTSARPTATDEVIKQEFIYKSNIDDDDYRFHFMKSTDGTSFRLFICNLGAAYSISCIEKTGTAVSGWNPAFFVLGYGKSTQQDGNKFLTITQVNGAFGKSIHNGEMDVYLTAEGRNSGASLASDTAMGNRFDNGIFMYPMGLVSPTTGKEGRHGSVVDMWLTLDQLPDGVTYPSDGSKNYIQFGCLVVPWNTTIPLLSV